LIGAVTSVVEPPRPLAEQLRVVPVVGPGIGTAAKQVVVVMEPETDQWRITLSPNVLPRYQPFVPAIPSME
jgi:hypothetical protein